MIGADAIIGGSCANNPAWTVPCYPADFEPVACAPHAIGEPDGLAALSEAPTCEVVSLSEPAVREVTLA